MFHVKHRRRFSRSTGLRTPAVPCFFSPRGRGAAIRIGRQPVTIRRCERPECDRILTGRRDARYCSPACRAAAAKDRADKRRQAQREAIARRGSPLTSAFTRAIGKTTRSPADGAAVALARLYARMIDADPSAIEKLGTQYLSVLVQLGMTPKARGGDIRSDPVATGPAGRALDELRDRRVRKAADLDTAP